MTSFDPRGLAPQFITGANKEKNDYHSYGGWGLPGNPAILLGQQYKFFKDEAQALVKQIDEGAFFTDPMLPKAPPIDVRRNVLEAIYDLTTKTATDTMSKGSISLSRRAAGVLNAYAKELGSEVRFKSGQPYPNHPVG